MKTKFIIFFCFFSNIIFGQNIDNVKSNEELSTEKAFDKIKEYILDNNSNALWELYKDTDIPSGSAFDNFFGKRTTNNKKMTFEEFSKLIEEIYIFVQENKIEKFNFGNFFDGNSTRSTNVSISSGVAVRTEKIRRCATLTPKYFNLLSDENFPLASNISDTKYNVCVEIEKKDTLDFRITSIYTETNYLEKDFDLFEYVKNNFANAENYFVSVKVFKPKQRITYSSLESALKKDIEIINKIKILHREENIKSLDVNELYFYGITTINQSKYVVLIFSEIDNKVLIVTDGKYGLFEINNIKPLRTYTDNLRKR